MAKSLGVYMTYILRHRPQAIGIAMDTLGWVSVEDFMQKAEWVKPITLAMILAEIESDEKGRFQINSNHSKMRCVQGHSVEHVILNLEAHTSQDVLYHGTAEKNVAAIYHEGISRQKRKHVHLSDNLNTAINVGQRHGAPVVFEIDTQAMLADGYKFYRAENGVILTDHVPSKYIHLLEADN